MQLANSTEDLKVGTRKATSRWGSTAWDLHYKSAYLLSSLLSSTQNPWYPPAVNRHELGLLFNSVCRHTLEGRTWPSNRPAPPPIRAAKRCTATGSPWQSTKGRLLQHISAATGTRVWMLSSKHSPFHRSAIKHQDVTLTASLHKVFILVSHEGQRGGKQPQKQTNSHTVQQYWLILK